MTLDSFKCRLLHMNPTSSGIMPGPASIRASLHLQHSRSLSRAASTLRGISGIRSSPIKAPGHLRRLAVTLRLLLCKWAQLILQSTPCIAATILMELLFLSTEPRSDRACRYRHCRVLISVRIEHHLSSWSREACG